MAEPIAGFTRLKQCRQGLMLFNINDVYIGRSLDLYGEFSEGEADLFRQLVRPDDFVIEIGANIGAHTITLANIVGPSGAVFAFEPQRIPFQILCANVALNNLSHVWAFHSAAGESPGEIRVPELDPRRPTNFGALSLNEKPHAGRSVAVVRVDGLTLPRCRMIKVDVEGMELPVLKGCSRLITQFKPFLYVENDRPEHSEALIRYVDSIGYDMYWHRPPLFNSANFNNHPENVFDNIASLNMLCIPRGARSSIQGLPRVEVPPPSAG